MRPFSQLRLFPYASLIPTKFRPPSQDSKVPCAAGDAFCRQISFYCGSLCQAWSTFFLDASRDNIWAWFQTLSFYSRIVDTSYVVLLKNQFLFLSQGSFFCPKGRFSAMRLHLLLVYLLDCFFKVTAKPFGPELHISNTATSFWKNGPLTGRSPQQENIFSDISDAGDASVFVDNQELFPSIPGVSGNDIALLDSGSYSLDQESPEFDLYDENTGLQAAQDPENPDLFVGSTGESVELATSCEGENDLDSFVDKPNMLTGRNLIDEFFDLRIPDEILAPKKLCPNPQDTKDSTSQPTENTSKLPFRVPLPDLAGKRCRIEDGEGPMYALCCFMEGNGNQENACYPGKVFLLLFWFLVSVSQFAFFSSWLCVFRFYDQSPSIIRFSS